MKKHFVIGTRGSKLALWQANEVRDRLDAAGFEAEIRVIRTTGDRRQDVPLAQIGGKGLFIKEIEEALERGEVDLAVHSLKDVPSIVPDSFALAGFLERGDPRDAWVHPEHSAIASLAAGSAIGTSSPRRRAQIKALFPQLDVRDIRGNVDTRIRKAQEGHYAGVVLAAAGLERLERQSDVTSYFSVEQIVPAAGQGIVTIETLADRSDALEAAAAISHGPTTIVAQCERGILQRFEDRLDCHTSIAAHAVLADDMITLSVFVSDLAGTRTIRTQAVASVAAAEDLLTSVAKRLSDQGALELIAGAHA
ncbi:MAG TPA: hydroxymethylbilane synthase [Thermoanaerobaculia bacterium]|nr:hydroxymethylbilane synthase [Thermoanaerobaculia bacterium]